MDYVQETTNFNNCIYKKRALVIGGSGGIGMEISKLLAKNGALLSVHGGHKSTKFNALCNELSELSGKKVNQIVQNISFDFDCNALNELKNSLLFNATKKTDILCICYGPFLQKPLEKTSALDWTKITLSNLALPGFLCSLAIPYMKKNKFGRILLFGGTRTNQINGFLTNPAYGAAKTGIASLTKSIAQNFATFGITANAIFPGFVKTEYVSKAQENIYKQKLCGKEMISAKEIAEKAIFLITNSELNGVLLNVDNGWTPNNNT